MPTTPDRLSALELRVAANSTLLQEIHTAVVSDGSPGSSLRERVTALETGAHAHASSHRWSTARSIAVAAATALGTAISIKLTIPTP